MNSVTQIRSLSTLLSQALADQGSGQQAAATETQATAASAQNEDVVSLSRNLAARNEQARKQAEAAGENASELFKYKAIFAVDDEKNVVVRIVDDKGKTIRQVPPEAYLKMSKEFREIDRSIFSKEA